MAEATVETQLPASHIEQSKSFFRQAMADVADKPQEISTEAVPPAETPPAQSPSSPDQQIKSAIPEDIISPPETKIETEKPSEAIAAIEAMQLPKSAKAEQVTNFATLKEKAKKEIESQATRIKELEGKIGKSTDKSEIEAWQAKLTAAEERASKIEEEFSRAAYEQSPHFRSKFIAREVTAIEGAKKVLEGTEVSPEIIEVAARLSGQKRRDVLKNAGIEGDLLSEVAPYLTSFDAVQNDKKAAIENWKGESAKLQEAANAKSQADKQRRVAEENRVWEAVSHKTDLLPLRKSKDNGEWNARAEELAGKAKQIFNGEGVPLDAFAETIQKGVAYDAVNDVLQKVMDENKNLKAENAKLKSARPGGSITVGGDQGKPDPAKLSPVDRAKATFNQELAAVGGR